MKIINSILVINSGSSSIKFSLFNYSKKLELLYRGELLETKSSLNLKVSDRGGELVFDKEMKYCTNNAVKYIFSWIEENLSKFRIAAVGHRVVHGGHDFDSPVLVTDNIIKKLEKLIPLAPLHQPYNIEAIKIINDSHPKTPQIACFDTGFHASQPDIAKLFAIPIEYAEEGIIRYGFHGLSYEYIASVLPKYAGKKANGRVIVAHLGNGASLCAMQKRKSMATTMGFTALDGLMMGTRCGSIDPGIIFYLMEQKGMCLEKIKDLMYNKSGLLGVSNISNDIKKLEENSSERAKLAIDMFCYHAAKKISSLIAVLGGLDVLVFTAGIGENSPLVRSKICDYFSWLGLVLDKKANKTGASKISANKSDIDIFVIPTDEQKIIADYTYKLMR